MEYVPFPEYDELSPEDKARIVNGCGPGGWKFDVVPDNILGVTIKEPCNRHDFAYYLGRDFDEANRNLLADIVTDIIKHQREQETRIGDIIDDALLRARLSIAIDYFMAVHIGGRKYFGKGDK